MRYTFTLFCFCLSLIAHAQIQRGDHILTLDRSATALGNARDLGGLFYQSESDNIGISVSPTYGYALTDRLVLGASPGIGLYNTDGDWGGGFALNPYLRYYLINQERLGVFGQVSTDLGVNDGGVYGFSSARLRTGLQLPLASGVRVGPTLDYFVNSGRNYFTLGGNIEIVLNAEDAGQEQPVGTFSKGTVMLGGQLADVRVSKNFTGGDLHLGGHYFLSDRFAAGMSVGLGAGEQDYSSSAQDFFYRYNRQSVDLSARYYFTTGKRLVWYGEAGGGYFRSVRRSESPFGSARLSEDGFSAFAAFGGQYFVRDNIALEFGPQLRQSFGAARNTNFGLSAGVRFFLR